jgi:hypothetical protein
MCICIRECAVCAYDQPAHGLALLPILYVYKYISYMYVHVYVNRFCGTWSAHAPALLLNPICMKDVYQ